MYDQSGRALIEYFWMKTIPEAKRRAGKRAIEHQCTVDLLFADKNLEPRRYITTITPSEKHAKGYKAERLAV